MMSSFIICFESYQHSFFLTHFLNFSKKGDTSTDHSTSTAAKRTVTQLLAPGASALLERRKQRKMMKLEAEKKKVGNENELCG